MNIKENILKKILSGTWIKESVYSAQVKFMLFLVFLAILQVSNRYSAEEMINKREYLVKELRNTKFEYLQIEKDLVNKSRESQLLKDSMIISLGLKLPKNPPKRIVIEKM